MELCNAQCKLRNTPRNANMATKPDTTPRDEDNRTEDMFNQGEKGQINEAISQYISGLRRKINTEKNPAIRAIHEQTLREYNNLINKIGGWK